MNSQKKIAELKPEEVARLLRLNYFKIGLELTKDSYEEKVLVSEIMAYQKNMWVAAFSDMFTKFAGRKIKGQEKLQPVFTGYFVSQLRKAFFATILTTKKISFRHNPPRYKFNKSVPSYSHSRRDYNSKSIGELVRAAL